MIHQSFPFVNSYCTSDVQLIWQSSASQNPSYTYLNLPKFYATRILHYTVLIKYSYAPVITVDQTQVFIAVLPWSRTTMYHKGRQEATINATHS